MKARILVAAIGIPLLLLGIFFAPPIAFAIFVGIISAGSAYEFLKCAKISSVRILAVTSVMAGIIPIGFSFGGWSIFVAAPIFLLFLYVFCELILTFGSEKLMALEDVTAVLFSGIVMPLLLSSMVRIGLRENRAVYLLLPFAVAFSCDSGAYFTGLSIGRHKLAPKLSPKKTIEGALGGFVSAVLVLLIYGFVLSWFGFDVKYGVLVSYGILGALACQIGDLSFSAVKRLYNVKDYGNLIPGHGGMLDRFDSMHMVAPMIELLIMWVPAFTK